MRAAARALRLAAQLAFGAASLVWLALARRGGVLVFTHEPDLGADGRDAQMGALVDALRARRASFFEVTFVSLDGGLLRNLRWKRRAFVPHAACVAVARALELAGVERGRARARVARALLRALAPPAALLIDESGSGQFYVAAARELGIRTVGIQHGDFQPSNPQYERGASRARGVVPVDVLCVWSEWFRSRLVEASEIYSRANTLVTGRARDPAPVPVARARVERAAHGLRVLVLGDARAGFEAELAPFVDALARAGGFEVELRPHPSAARGGGSSLARALDAADVALGIGSSALLEAVRHGVPGIVVGAADPSGYARAGVVDACADPSELPADVRRAAALTDAVRSGRCERVWGADGPGAADRILETIAGSIRPG